MILNNKWYVLWIFFLISVKYLLANGNVQCNILKLKSAKQKVTVPLLSELEK